MTSSFKVQRLLKVMSIDTSPAWKVRVSIDEHEAYGLISLDMLILLN